MNIINKLNVSAVDKVAKKIGNQFDNQDFEIKQFILDTISGNYKLDRKTKQNFIIYIGLLVIPIEDIIGAVVPRLKPIYSFISTPLDEVAIISKLVMIIKDEYVKYNKFISRDSYVKTEFTDIKTIDININSYFELLKSVMNIEFTKKETSTDLVTNEMRKIYEPSTIFQYTDDDYKYLIIEYLIANNKGEKGVKIDYKEISRNVIFKTYFDIDQCQRVVQNEMSGIIDKNGIEELHTYRLSHPMQIERNYYTKSKVQTETIVENSNIQYLDNSTVIEYNEKLTVQLIAKLINLVTVLNYNDKQNISAVINKDIIIEFGNNSKVQVISRNIECLKLAIEIENELNYVLSHSKLKKTKGVLTKKTKESLVKKKITDEQIIELSIIAFINRIISDEDGKEIEIKISDLRYFIPFYNKKNLTRYLHLLEDSEHCVRVSDKVIVMKSKQVKFTLNPESISFETLFFNRDCIGNYDYKHLIEIAQTNFVIQSIYSECSDLDVNLFMSCGNKIYIGVHIGKQATVKLIDLEMNLGNEKGYNIEQLLTDELKYNSKALEILSKA